MISINPDAHEKQGYHDMFFGTLAARKGGLLTKNTLNALSLRNLKNTCLIERARYSETYFNNQIQLYWRYCALQSGFTESKKPIPEC